MFKNICFVLLVIMIVSCKNQDVRTDIHLFSNQIWNKFETVSFEQNFDEKCKIEIRLRAFVKESFEYSDVKLQYEWISPEGESKLNYCSISVMDNQGQGIKANKDGLIEVEIILFKNEFINVPGKYTLLIDNMMPNYNTNEIISIQAETLISDY